MLAICFLQDMTSRGSAMESVSRDREPKSPARPEKSQETHPHRSLLGIQNPPVKDLAPKKTTREATRLRESSGKTYSILLLGGQLL